MPNAAKMEKYTSLILDFLKDNPGTYFQQREIVSALKSKITEEGDYHLEYPLNMLVITGMVQGRIRGTKIVDIAWKDSYSASSDSSDPSREQAYQAKIREATEMIKQLNSAVSGQRQEIDLYKELVEELRKKEAAERIVKVVVQREKGKPREFTETFHGCFEDLTTLANARENIFLYGPTGSGKTFIASQMARVLGLDFYFISCTQGMSESSLNGRLLPTGEKGKFEYTASEFVKAYENGGVFLADEIDAADPNVLLIINTALANNRFPVPGRIEKPYAEKHPDFVFIAAANTIGNGSDRQYSGRAKLDASTMDRFGVGKLFVDYDPVVEAALCPDGALRERFLRYRKAINANRLERAMSTRFLEKAYKMFQLGWSVERIDATYFMGWREDEINKVKSF